MATKFEKQVLAALTAGLEAMLDQLWKIDPDSDERPVQTSLPLAITTPTDSPHTRIGEAVARAITAPFEIDEHRNLLPPSGRLPYFKLTADMVASAVAKWEASTTEPLDRFRTLLYEFGCDYATLTEILLGKHPLSSRPARGMTMGTPPKPRTFLKRADLLNMRREWVDLCATRSPAHGDLVRLSIRYDVGTATARDILRGVHRNLAAKNGGAS